ncbi:MAG: hypothetical protein ABW162_08145 [Candidatus Sedimenticola sp. PURPLELP]
MSYRLKFFVFVLGAALTLSATKVFAGEPVSICGETWSPFLYESGGNGQENKKITGLHLDNFRLLSELTGLEFKFNLIPWKRCLNDVENFSQPGDPEIAIDASFSKERAENYNLVGPMYAIGTAVWYSRKRFPDGPLSKKSGRVISWINEMRDYRLCGVLGWNYDMYFVEHGIPRSNEVIRSPAGLQGMFGMLSKGRCDLAEHHPALVVGAMLSGELEMPKDIACSKMNEEPEAFYLMVSRKSPRAEELVTSLSTGLIYLKGTLRWKLIEDIAFLPAAGVADAIKECL